MSFGLTCLQRGYPFSVSLRVSFTISLSLSFAVLTFTLIAPASEFTNPVFFSSAQENPYASALIVKHYDGFFIINGELFTTTSVS